MKQFQIERKLKEFNIEQDHYSYKQFIDLCKESFQLGEDHYCIKITTNQDISYHCSVQLYKVYFVIYFLNTDACYDGEAGSFPTNPLLTHRNKSTFLYLTVFGFDNPASSSITTRITFPTLHHDGKALTPLETIIYIRCYFYRMVSVTQYRTSDAANGVCTKGGMNYLLFIYRLFQNDKVVDAEFVRTLSIYYKYFRKIYNDETKEEIKYDDPEVLGKIEAIRALTYNFGRGPELLVDHFATFTRTSENCDHFAKQLETVHATLDTTNQLYAETIALLTNFIVHPEDCIYYIPLRKGRSPTRKSSSRKLHNRASSPRRGIRSPGRSTIRSPTIRSRGRSANKP